MLENTPDEVGVDEVGMGCLWGFVAAGAVLMPSSFEDDDKLVKLIKDSKKCSPKLRAKLSDYIKTNAVTYGIGTASVEEIDTYNIFNARNLAMQRAVDMARSKHHFDKAVVDGVYFSHPDEALEHRCVVDGDNAYLNVAAASIIAKVYRDNYVINMVKEHPELQERYGFESNKGYGTKKHMDGLAKYGVTELHRKSYAPVKRAMMVP